MGPCAHPFPSFFFWGSRASRRRSVSLSRTELAPEYNFQVRLELDVDENADYQGLTKENFDSIDVAIEFPGHIIVGLDARDGKVAIDGWSKLSHHDVIDLAQKFEADGVEAIIYTDISRDGMMSGVNAEATAKLARSIRIPVIASGGITDINDINELGKFVNDGIMGAITGRAIYEGTLDFAAAAKLAESFN